MFKCIIFEKFICYGNVVLFGIVLFWEGVDVRGSILSCVIIDKLLFVVLDDFLL